MNNIATQAVEAIDLRTVEHTKDNPSYVIDSRLLDELLSRVTRGDITDIKDDLRREINLGQDREDVFDRLDRYIYLDRIVRLVHERTELNEIERM